MPEPIEPLGWYIVGEDKNYYIAAIVKKYPDPKDTGIAEHIEAFDFVKNLFHAGTPVHAVRIDESEARKSSGHKIMRD
jgi:hypothetical protein